MNEDEDVPAPPILVRYKADGVDLDFIWKHRHVPRFKDMVVDTFYRQKLPQNWRMRMSHVHVKEVLRNRRNLVKVANIVRSVSADNQARRFIMKDVLKDEHMIDDLSEIIGEFV